MSLRVLSLNVEMFSWKFNLDNSATRSDSIIRKILEDDYDIVCLQQLFDRNARDKFIKLLNIRYPYLNIDENYGSYLVGSNSGLSIFSKFPINEKYQHSFSNYGGSDHLSKKGIMGIQITFQEKPLYIYNTHLQSGSSDEFKSSYSSISYSPPLHSMSSLSNMFGYGPTSEEIRMKQIDECMGKIMTWSNYNMNPSFILTGEFNILTKESNILYKNLIKQVNVFDNTVKDSFNFSFSLHQTGLTESDKRTNYTFITNQLQGDCIMTDRFRENTPHVALAGIYKF